MDLHETTNKPVKDICKITNISEAIFLSSMERISEYKKCGDSGRIIERILFFTT